jgi:DNA-binding transcriptional MocR family regulator
VLFAEFKGPLTAAELGEQLAASGISVKPSYCFTQDPRDGQHIRLGFGEDKLVPAAVEALATLIEEKRGGWGRPRK